MAKERIVFVIEVDFVIWRVDSYRRYDCPEEEFWVASSKIDAIFLAGQGRSISAIEATHFTTSNADNLKAMPSSISTARRFTPRSLQTLSLVLLLGSLTWFVISSIHWPLIGDASLMHYVVFLMDHGKAPYRDILDINFPGSYLPDWLVMHTLGLSSLAWRLYDLFILGAAALGIAKIGDRSWRSGLWAGLLFCLIHGRDGLYQVGQRDLTISAFLLCSSVALFSAKARKYAWPFFVFGVGVGAATTIKPIALLFLLLVPPVIWHGYKGKVATGAALLNLGFGCLLPLAAAALWLFHIGSLTSFLRIQTLLTPYHASLARKPLGFLLLHAFSPILPFAGAWLLLRSAAAFQARSLRQAQDSWDVAKLQGLWLGSLLGLVLYIVQGKGYPYHRYTFIAFMLASIVNDLEGFLQDRPAFVRWASATVLLAGALAYGVYSAIMIGRYQWQEHQFGSLLQQDLGSIVRRDPQLSGKVQCIDSISGCIGALYDMRYVQATGLIYDEFLLRPGGAEAIDTTRAMFEKAVETNPPAVFIVTSALFPSGPGGFRKLAQWPAFNTWLNLHYALAAEEGSMSAVRQGGPAFTPPGFRIYIRRELTRY